MRLSHDVYGFVIIVCSGAQASSMSKKPMDCCQLTESRQDRPLKLGVTGGVGSGKSVVCNFLARKGFTVISADELSRRAVLPGTEAYEKIVACFGPMILSQDGGLDRKKLRAIITQDRQAKQQLESFVHPEVFRLMEAEYAAAARRQESVVVVEVPLLFELGLKSVFDIIVTVSADQNTRIHRMMQRDQVTESEARSLVGIQLDEEEKIKQSDFFINNNGNMEALNASMEAFYRQLLERISLLRNC